MPEVNQYTLNSKELATAIVKELGVHEGKWMLIVSFGFTATNAGPEGGELIPSAILGVQRIGIQRADQNSPPSLVIDAAVVNPPDK